MQMNHTNGRWEYREIPTPADMPAWVVLVEGARPDLPEQHIATMGIQSAEDRANGRLIAASPDLLHIAILIVEEWEKPTEGVQRGELIARLPQYAPEARAALKKAGVL